jgi:hypothetical protein
VSFFPGGATKPTVPICLQYYHPAAGNLSH